MRLALVTVKRRPDSDAISRRETLLEGEEFRVGRGADVDVNLPDVDVAYHHATISEGPDGLVLSAVGDAHVETEGKPAQRVALRPGVVCRIGDYQIGVEPAPAQADHAITVQRREARAALKAGPPQRIADALPSRRRLSWLAAFAVLAVFLAWPLAAILTRDAPPEAGAVVVTAMTGEREAAEPTDWGAVIDAVSRGEAPSFGSGLSSPMETAWLSGPMSRAHAGLGEECEACHLRPFEQTTNAACLACHADVSSHAKVAAHPAMALENFRCAACHKEHVGGESPIEQASSVCTDCHADLKSVTTTSVLFDVSDFASDHPQFRPTLVTGVATAPDSSLDPTVARAPLDAKYPLAERSGLKFPHDVHLNEEGVRGLGRASDKTWEMNCESCHVPQADGRLMRPIQMERDCGYCHELTFQPANLDVLRELPHAKAVEVGEIVRDYYAARVLEGGLNAPGAPQSVRRRPGIPLLGEERADALAWASEQAEQELRAIMEVRLCGDCHVAEAKPDPDARGRTIWTVQGALLQRRWMPKSVFNHEPHFAMDCVSCHAAPTSDQSTDVLMPPIGTCRECHLGEDAGAASASSECLACHEFHIDQYGPMSPDHGAAMTARRNEAERSTVTRQSP